MSIKTKLMQFIPKFNQVVFFLGSIAFLIFFSAMLIKGWVNSSDYRSGIQVISTQDQELNPPKINYQRSYYMSIKDIHIIKVVSESIYLYENESESRIFNLYSNGYSDRNLVNLIFSSETGSTLQLFENDLLITDIEPARFNEESGYPLLSKNIYSVVSQDSNSDSLLNRKDQVDLYVSDYNGQNLTLIHQDIEDLKVMENNKLLVMTNQSNNFEMFIYDVNSGEKNKLNTSIN